MAVGNPNPIGALTGANDGLADNIIGHAVNLERLKAGEIQAVYAMLRKVQGDLIEQLNSLDPTAVGGKTQAKRLVRLLKNTQATIRANYNAIQKAHATSLAKVADLEGKAIQKAVGIGVAGEPKVGIAMVSALPPTTTLRALVDDTLIMGAPQKEHWARQAGDLQQRFQDQMREGILAGESVDDLVRRIRGTAANAFKDGIMEVKRYQAAALVRTSVQAVSNAARNATIAANKDIFDGVQWLSTLDSRTSDICKARSGLRWDNDFKPVGHNKSWSPPPAHWNCRSVVTPITKTWEQLAGTKLTRNADDFNASFKDELAKAGLSADAIAKLRPKMQASMDGMVPAEFSYEDWIKSKPEAFQQQVLGLAKWRLWNSGKIAFVDLVDQRSNPLSLADLEALIDAGKTSIARASKAAKQAAKAEAEAAAKEAAALAKKELDAEKLLGTYAAGGKGFSNHKITFDKLTKQGKLEGKTFQEQVALVQAGKEAIDTASKLSNIKKKFKDGKKLSPSELAVYKTLDAATKEEYRTLKAAQQLKKQVAQAKEDFDAAYLDAPITFTPQVLAAYDAVSDLKSSQIQKALAGMNDAEQLAHLQVLKGKLDNIVAMEKQFSSEINDYFLAANLDDAVLPGKQVTLIKAKGDADSLSNKAIAGMLDDAYEKQLAVAAQAEAAAEQTLISFLNAGKGSGLLTQKKVLTELMGDSEFSSLTFTAQLAKVKDTAKAVKAKADFDSLKSTISTKLAKGDNLTPAQQTWVSNLDEDGQDLLQAAVSKKQQKLGIGPKTPKPPPTTAENKPAMVFSDFEQTGPQGGSNLGGTFTHQRSGVEYYIKTPPSEQAARVEVLSAKLYQMAGVKVADVDLIQVTGNIGTTNAAGRLGIASRIEKVSDLEASQMPKVSGAKDGFAADAWLANHDVIGNGGAKELNLKKLADGTAIRVDTGGTLFYRAQGGRKVFDGNDVPELDSLRTFPNNPNARTVFGDVSEDQIVAGVARIVAISDDDIRRVVAETMGDAAEDLAEVLIGRKRFLEQKYKAQLAKLNKAEPTELTAGITKVEARAIDESGSNGYAIATDKDQIEDQLIHFSEYAEKDRSRSTIGFLKVRNQAKDSLEKSIKTVSKDATEVEFGDLDNQILTAIKGISMRAKKGEFFEQKDYDRAIAAMKGYRDKLDEMRELQKQGSITAADVAKFEQHYKPWVKDLEATAKTSGDLTAAFWNPHTSANFSGVGPFKLVSKVKTTGITWQRKRSAWNEKTFKDGKATDTGREGYTNDTDMFVTEVDGVTVRYWSDDAPVALRNRLEIITNSSGAVTVEKQLAVLKKLGVDSSRATALDREELYLVRTLYAQAAEQGRRGSWWATRTKKMASITDQEERLAYLRKEASKAAGVDDITASPTYRPLGDWQQFGHGRIVQFRPDVNTAEWQKFTNDYVLRHELYDGVSLQSIKNIVESGGHMAPTMDKLRRGITPKGMSPESDIRTGGASYFFTRLRSKRSATNSPGLVWKGRQATRLDAISYDGDRYGNTESIQSVLGNRKVTIEGLRDAARQGSNETIFKDSLSIYDDLLYIVVGRRSEREAIIEYLKTKMQRWPDGRKIEDVVVLET